MKSAHAIIPHERIENKIFLIRGKKVMFDRDLADLYGVETGALNQAVKRNKGRFPADFMFQLADHEIKIWQEYILRSQTVILKKSNLRSQNVTSRQGKHIKFAPYVFTEQGVAMLSSVLKSKQAVQVNIQIMRTFTKIREMLVSNKDLRERIEALEKKYDKHFKKVFEAINNLLFAKEKESHRPLIGFKSKE